jgi:hypothetical protein
MLGFKKKAAQFGHPAPAGIHGEDKADIDMGLGLLPFGQSSAPFGTEHKHRRAGHGSSHHGEFEGSVDGDVSVEDPIADGEDVGPFGDHHIDLPGGSLHEQDDYGQGDTGTGVNNVLGSGGGGGVDPFQVAAFGGDEAAPSPTAEFETDLVSTNLEDLASNEGENMSYQPADLDPFASPDQVPTLRNPVIAFGDDMAGDLYSGFGPAAVIGDEDGCFLGGMKG